MTKEKLGSVFGGVLLVAGCSIGAGMLGLPVLSAAAGFIPSTVLFNLAWLFMLATGLLLLEVNLTFKEEVSIISIAKSMLGRYGEISAWFLYLFLFYSLLVAYIAGSGTLLANVLDDFGIFISHPLGSLICTGFFAISVFCGTRIVDHFNRYLMLGLVVSYVGLLAIGIQHIDIDLLKVQNWSAVRFVVPAMIISFGYHNLVPSLTTYLNHDAKRLRIVLILGSLLPLIIYLLWEGLILGIVPAEQFEAALDAGEIATSALRNAAGSRAVFLLAEHFAFFALVSSFITVALSFVDFLADGLSIPKDTKGKWLLIALSFIPPLLSAYFFPGIFLSALNYAGAFGAVILFGILPVLMVWKKRQRPIQSPVLLPGGSFTLILVFLMSVLIIAIKLWDDFSF